MKTVSFATASLIAMIVSANAAPIEYKKGNFLSKSNIFLELLLGLKFSIKLLLALFSPPPIK